MTQYVGVRNSRVKTAALARPAVRRVEADPQSLAFDCIRHLDLLARVQAGGEPRDSLYWRYFLLTGRDHEYAARRCGELLDLYSEMQTRGYDVSRGRIAVTDDGVRLDGSHRAAVAAALGLGPLEVDVHDTPRGWRPVAAEARVKRDGQRRFLGRSVYGDGRVLGTVAFVDSEQKQRRFLPRPPTLVLVVDSDGELRRVPAAEVEIR